MPSAAVVISLFMVKTSEHYIFEVFFSQPVLSAAHKNGLPGFSVAGPEVG